MRETLSLLVNRNFGVCFKILSLHTATDSLWFLLWRKSIVVETTIVYFTKVDIERQMKEFIDLVRAVTIANQNCKRGQLFN